MKPYLNDDDFYRYFEYLQIIGIVDLPNSYEKWTQHRANTSHIDTYGVTINRGDAYYKRILSNRELKLSHQSMDKYLYLLFEETPELQSKCESLLEKQKAQTAQRKSRREW